MSRTPIHSYEQIKAAVDAILAQGGLRAPVPSAHFRRAISVRRLRDALGGGDHARLARTLRQLENEYSAPTPGSRPLPAVPDNVADLMERAWATAVAAAEAETLPLREEAAREVATERAAREDADVRVDLLRKELADRSATLEARNQQIGQLEAQLAASQEELAVASRRINDCLARLSAVEEEGLAERQRFQRETAQIREEYEGLRVSLLTSTDAQRQDAIQHRTDLERHLRRTEQLLKEVERDRDRLQEKLRQREGRPPTSA